MTTVGPNLGLMDDGRYGEDVYSETLRMYRALDSLVQPRVLSISVVTPPLSPIDGDTYIVPQGASGLWSGKQNQIARWTNRPAAIESKWEFFIPKNGWEFSVDDIDCKVRFTGTDWVGSSVVVSTLPPDNNDGRPDGTVYLQI